VTPGALTKAIAQALSPAGFRRFGQTLNRDRDGLVDVVVLRAGRDDPEPPLGGHRLPTRSSSLKGLYAVELGIHVPEIWDLEVGSLISGAVQEFHCQPRKRLHDGWLPLPEPHQVAAHAIAAADAGLAFFGTWTRASLLSGWVAANEGPDGLTPRARVDVAIMLARAGRLGEAGRLLGEQRRRTGAAGHAAYVEHLAGRLGIALPAQK
jgi:hypothetical protein